MKIFVSVKPSAAKEIVERIDGNHLKVSVTEPPVEGRANRAVARAIAEFFGLPVSSVRLIRGFASRQKIFEIS